MTHGYLVVVGGISRTVERDGWRFDIGGHRFFTKVKEVDGLWHEILPDEDFLMRPRMSRIYYRGKYYDYPSRPATRSRDLGLIEAVLCVLSYAWVRIRPRRTSRRSRVGSPPGSAGASTSTSSRPTTRRCGACPSTSCRPTGPPSASRTCRSATPVVNALLPKRNQKDITSLIEEFQYPKYGPG